MDSTSIYIGNIPFDYTEEQMMEIAGSVGPVDELKLLFDPVTGKSKGYAFVRYHDHETAASAVRNLNFMNLGNRYLKCAFSSDDEAFPDPSLANFATNAKLPPLPLGAQLYANQTPQSSISSTLSTMDQQSAYKIMKEAQQMSLENPELMKKLLTQCPQLAHALVELSLLVNLTNKDLIGLCVDKKQPELNDLSYDHVQLLNQVNLLTEEQLAELQEDKRNVVTQIRNEINKGSYGVIS